MTAEQLETLQVELESLSDAELASLIIERVDVETVASLLSEEVFRRLSHLRQQANKMPLRLMLVGAN